jgi:Zn-dependent protease
MPEPVASSPQGNGRPQRLRLRVLLGFLLSAVLPGLAQGLRGMLVWGTVVFLSLVAHELGHAAVGLAYGRRAMIVMHPLGGTTQMDPPLSRGGSIVAHIAGPVVSLALGLAAAWMRTRLGHPAWLTVATWVNLGWAGLNLVPVPPFDGGRALMEAMGPQRTTSALAIAASFAAGLGMTGFCIVRSAALSAVFGGLAVYTTIEWVKRRHAEVDLRLGLATQLQNAETLLGHGRLREAKEIAQGVLQCARSKATQRKASEVVAWCFLEQGRPEDAWRTLVAAGPLPALDATCRAAVEEARGRETVAIEILERARRSDSLRAEGVKRLVDVYARRGRFDLVCRVAREEVRRLEPDDARRVVQAAVEAGAFTGAADIASALFVTLSAPDDGITLAYALAKGGQPQRAVEVLERVATLPAGAIGRGAERLLSELGRQRPFDKVVPTLLTRTFTGPLT